MYLVPFLRYSASNNDVTLKSGVGVVQSCWKWYRSKACVRFLVHIYYGRAKYLSTIEFCSCSLAVDTFVSYGVGEKLVCVGIFRRTLDLRMRQLCLYEWTPAKCKQTFCDCLSWFRFSYYTAYGTSRPSVVFLSSLTLVYQRGSR